MDGDMNDNAKVLCLNSCGFYGSRVTENYCSICYKDFLRKKDTGTTDQTKPEDVSMKVSMNEAGSLPQENVQLLQAQASQDATEIKTFENVGPSCQNPSGSTSMSSSSSPSTPVQAEDNNGASSSSASEKKKLRCGFCKKKVGLTGFTCRCGGLYCSVHRYSDKHECNFDYRQHGACEIRKNNPQVLSRKIEKI